MIAFPDINPIALELGPVAIHWYGLSYIVGIGLGWWYLVRAAARAQPSWTSEAVADVVFFAALGAVLGGRIGYILFYDLAAYIAEPLNIFKLWQGGMSFHGGLIGTIVALLWFAAKTRRHLLTVSDFLLPALPIGLGLGRVANFINQELWGAPSLVPWAVVFSS